MGRSCGHGARRRSGVGWFFRNPDTGEIVVAQWPNLPLWTFLAASAVRLLLHPDGIAGTVVSIVSTTALVVWALLEIAAGSSPFRRALGAAVLLTALAGLLRR
jgi:hypothetical protein